MGAQDHRKHLDKFVLHMQHEFVQATGVLVSEPAEDFLILILLLIHKRPL
jgi:hypothetical protein